MPYLSAFYIKIIDMTSQAWQVLCVKVIQIFPKHIPLPYNDFQLLDIFKGKLRNALFRTPAKVFTEK